MKQFAKALEAPPIQLAVAAVIIVGFVYLIVRKTASDIGKATGLDTTGTAYEGSGVVGTIANIANKATGGALQSAGEKISAYFFPDPGAGESLYYTFTLPDGSRGSIASGSVDANGFFTRSGKRYRLAWNSEIPRKRIAIAA